MFIEVDSLSGELSPARRALAARIATESFSWLSDAIRGVVMRVPEANGAARRTASVVVVLRDGRRFDALATEDSAADAIERACHDVRYEIAAALGRPFRRRRVADVLPPELGAVERRAAR